MGQDKRRQVVGHSYGPSRRSQIMFFVAVAAVAVVIVGGWLVLVGLFDKPPTHFKDSAPWSATPASAELSAEQSVAPVAPSSPCGEPGNTYPIPPRVPARRPTRRTPSGQLKRSVARHVRSGPHGPALLVARRGEGT
jgi:hypothetical protein